MRVLDSLWVSVELSAVGEKHSNQLSRESRVALFVTKFINYSDYFFGECIFASLLNSTLVKTTNVG